MVRAGVFTETGQDKVEVRDDVEVLGPDAGEVKVRLRAAGVCHSDISAMNGTLPQPPPSVLGHEGSGDVIEVGEGVHGVAEGDRVIALWSAPCGECFNCSKEQGYMCLTAVIGNMTNPRFKVGETPYFGMSGTGTFAEELTLPATSVVRVADDVPYEVAALIGCGVMTGVGSVLNVANVQPGESVAVVGSGGVGISVIQGARVAGAEIIVAIDRVEKKLGWARQFGATHAITPEQAEETKQELTAGEGYDHVFEVVGAPATIRSAYDLTRRGGQTIIVGVGRAEDSVSFSPFELFFTDRRILPSVFGRATLPDDFHRMISLWREGKLDLEGMVTARMPLENVNDAFANLHTGEVIRQILTFD